MNNAADRVEHLALAAEFPAASRADWRRVAAAVLRRSGAAADVDPEQQLASATYDGIAVRPLYTAEDVQDLAPVGGPGGFPFTRGATADGATLGGWDVRQRHADPDPAQTAAAIADDLVGGVTSLWLVAGGDGLAVDDLVTVLGDVDLAAVPVALDGGPETGRAARVLLGEGLGSGSLGADPIGARARTGVDADLSLLGRLAADACDRPDLRIATVDATRYHDAGAGDAAELGIATALGVAYLRALTDAGRSVEAALAALEFRLAVTDDQFAAIAKLRAARQVWGRVAELCGAAPFGGQHQHAVTSAAMLTQRDPWVNLLRTTIAAFAAATAGAGAITVLPFDHAIGQSNAFARRIARNTQAILHDESSLGRVVDAAGGSWYVEARTAALADRAWDVFTGIERAGGALAALDDGVLDELVAAARNQRAEDIAHRRYPITGVSEFAPITEPAIDRLPPTTGLTGGRPALQGHRYAEPFEALRDRAEAAAERPRVFLATLGPIAEYGARASFAVNLFQAGGFEVMPGPPAQFPDSGASVGCLCGSDDRYAAEALAAAATLRQGGARVVWLVGRSLVDGVDDVVNAGSDALAVLRTSLDASLTAGAS